MTQAKDSAMGAGLTLRVLGSGSCELRAERSSPCYLVEGGGRRMLLDLGQGAWRRLAEAGRDPATVTEVLLSHHHLDHLADLLPLLFALNYDPHLSANTSINLVGHSLVGQVLGGLADVFGQWVSPAPERLTTHWLAPGQGLSLGGIRVEAAPARHIDSSLAYRLTLGRTSLVYLGDSEATDELAEFARGCGLLVAHTAAPDHAPKPGHLTPAAAGRLAAAAGAGSLLLSHLYRAVDPAEAETSARSHFGGPVTAAADHLELLVSEGI